MPLYYYHNNSAQNEAIISVVHASTLLQPYSCSPSWAAADETEEPVTVAINTVVTIVD